MDDKSVKVDNGESSGAPRPFPTNYASNGRIMVISVAILFVALLIIAFFHVYTRWFRVRRHLMIIGLHHHRRPPGHQSQDHDHLASDSQELGLGPSLVKALPTFLYSSTSHEPSLECAVCMSEFEEAEAGRVLPNCRHSFHVECIDMWFRTHSNCPLCRAPVQKPNGTAFIMLRVEPEIRASSNDSASVPTTTFSSLVQERKIPDQLTSIRAETSQLTPCSSAPVINSG